MAVYAPPKTSGSTRTRGSLQEWGNNYRAPGGSAEGGASSGEDMCMRASGGRGQQQAQALGNQKLAEAMEAAR